VVDLPSGHADAGRRRRRDAGSLVQPYPVPKLSAAACALRLARPRTADVSCRGMPEELLFDRVPAESGDGAQPPCDGRPGPASSLQLPGDGFDAGPADGEQGPRPGRHQVVNWRRSSAYAAPVKAGWIAASAAAGTAVIIGHLPAGLEPGGTSPVAGPSN